MAKKKDQLKPTVYAIPGENGDEVLVLMPAEQAKQIEGARLVKPSG
jgi:hypothetical protein